MSPLTAKLELLRLVMAVYWIQELDALVYKDHVTVLGAGLFAYRCRLTKRFAFPFVTASMIDLAAHVNGMGKAPLAFGTAPSREHIMPADWLSEQGYDPSIRPGRPLLGRLPNTVYIAKGEYEREAYMFEDGDEQLAVAVSETVLAYAGAL